MVVEACVSIPDAAELNEPTPREFVARCQLQHRVELGRP
jgi:hypothetical protein